MNTYNHSFRQWLERHQPSAFLLAAQLLSLVLYAAFEGSANRQTLLGTLGILILVLVVWVIDRSPAVLWVAWILVAPAILLSLLSLLLNIPSLLVWSTLLEAVLYFYAAGSLVAYMMEDFHVTTDELYAAGATFTLLAWGFAYAYLVCQSLFPNSFISAIDPDQPRTFLEFLSLSFTNLSATGLGDILPVSPPARILVMLEQFSGVGYIAVVVSRLIGMTIGRQKEKETS
jgi:hypothetical protein